MAGEGMLRRKGRLARRTAHELVLAMAKYGSLDGHGSFPRFGTDAEVKRFFAQAGGVFEQVVERCRDPLEHVPLVENLMGGGHWYVNASGGGSVALVDLSSPEEKEIVKVEETGVLVESSYQYLFHLAVAAVGRAVAEGSWGDWLTGVSNGVASIEAYVSYRAEEWNKRHPQEALIDSRAAKVSFETKLEVWLPRMTQGRKLDRSDSVWRDFLILRAIRDDEAIHVKRSVSGVTYKQMAETINRFRAGIAALLMRLHLLFNEPVPSQIIRAVHAADVEIVPPVAEAAPGGP